jgi:hypothetical protein
MKLKVTFLSKFTAGTILVASIALTGCRASGTSAAPVEVQSATTSSSPGVDLTLNPTMPECIYPTATTGNSTQPTPNKDQQRSLDSGGRTEMLKATVPYAGAVIAHGLQTNAFGVATIALPASANMTLPMTGKSGWVILASKNCSASVRVYARVTGSDPTKWVVDSSKPIMGAALRNKQNRPVSEVLFNSPRLSDSRLAPGSYWSTACWTTAQTRESSEELVAQGADMATLDQLDNQAIGQFYENMEDWFGNWQANTTT